MQIPDGIRKSVAFVCYRATNKNDSLRLVGTAFYVTVPADDGSYTFGYIVTAKHLIVNIKEHSVDGNVYLRINKTDGTSAVHTSHVIDWRFHPDDHSVDVAVLSGFFSQDDFDTQPLDVALAASEKIIQENEIGIGDEVFLPGLFSNHAGYERNLPIVRIGNIAMMPEEPVNVGKLGPTDAYLIEARSIGGLSGSPVFVNLGASRIYGDTAHPNRGARFYWIGLMHGHWDAQVSEEDAIAEDIVAKDRVNMGIAIVIPVAKILEVIHQEAFMKLRQETLRQRKEALN